MAKEMESLFQVFYQEKKLLVDRVISNYIASIPDQDIPAPLQDAMVYAMEGEGKRLRPVLVHLGLECCLNFFKNQKKEVEHLDTLGEIANDFSLAMELIHTYSLVHDDLPAMDNDVLRRGRPTCHVRFDEATAILLGDTLLNQAYEILFNRLKMLGESHLALSSGIIRGCHLLANAAGPEGMIGGQILDMAAENTEIDIQALKQLHFYKTGKLIHAALLIFPTFFNIAELMEPLKIYANHLGLAFQVVDDVLDVTRTKEELGKSGTDQSNQKSTFVKLMGLEKSQSYAQELTEQAQKNFHSLVDKNYVDHTIKGYYDGLARFVIARNK